LPSISSLFALKGEPPDHTADGFQNSLCLSSSHTRVVEWGSVELGVLHGLGDVQAAMREEDFQKKQERLDQLTLAWIQVRRRRPQRR